MHRGDLGVTREQPHTPHWALVRTLFPVAESVADLIYDSKGTAAALTNVLANECDAVRPGAYMPVAATVTVLYRHSLTHQDEPRVLKHGNVDVLWKIHPAGSGHLRVTPEGGKALRINFDPEAFYEDLLKVLQQAAAKSWGDHARDRYNDWLLLDLATTEQYANIKAAKGEIDALARAHGITP